MYNLIVGVIILVDRIYEWIEQSPTLQLIFEVSNVLNCGEDVT